MFSDRIGDFTVRQSTGVEVAAAYQQLQEKGGNATPEKPFADEDVAEFIRLSKLDCDLPSRRDSRSYSFSCFPGLEQAVRDRYWVPLPSADPSDPLPEGEEVTSGRKLGLEQQLDRLLAIRRVHEQVGYHSAWNSSELNDFWTVSEELLSWAISPEQTPELLLQAVNELSAIDRRRTNPSDLVLRTYLDAIAVANGAEQPQFLRQKDYHPMITDWLAYFAHHLRGEQTRSERAARILGTLALEYALQSEQLLAPMLRMTCMC